MKLVPKQTRILKEKEPPRINMVGIKDVPTVKALLNRDKDKIMKLVTLNNDIWKINTPGSDTCRFLATKLNEERLQWYTYED